ncbi:tail completion protein gp17 [Novosphingobium sp. JCM 18896]|uniref:tail completion protein gp17 n=1 Tax=Novosphingobium sp. JCM 18896 TaxID=2989731 RepID=UPI002222E073|nr:DUF3168 domain-containing protein [Novosphingobium sp. JCM 18896]MCW1431402.1 DUF3168 domain-containing protein [Novosphingobium sp. JCM 18896]
MSDGVAVVRQLLLASSDLLATVPASRIAAGPMPLGITLPALSISSISSVDENIPAPGATRFVRERVRVTAMSPNYPTVKALIRKVRKALADQAPEVAGLQHVTVHTDGTGGDYMNDEASIRMSDQDVIVKFNEAR